MSTRKPSTLELTTTDSEANHALSLMQLRAAGVSVPRSAVLSARVSIQARNRVQALARSWGTTPSRMLGSVLAMLSASDTVAPAPADLKALRAVCSALGVPADSDAETIKIALIALLEAAAPPEPNADSLAASPDSPVPGTANPAALSATDQKKWLDDRAAKRAKRAAKRLAPGKISNPPAPKHPKENTSK